MDNFSDAQKALSLAEKSSGSAMRENAKYMESLSSKINLAKAEFQELVLGEGGLSAFLGILIDTGTQLLKFANSDLGDTIIKTTAITSTILLLNKELKVLSHNFLEAGTKAMLMSQGMDAQTASIWASQFATTSYTASLKALTVAFLASPFGKVAMVVGGVIAVVKAIDHFTESTGEARARLSELNGEYEQHTKKVKDLSDKLKDVSEKIDELNSKDGLSITEEQDLQTLQAESKELEYQLAIEREKVRLAQEEANKKADKVFSEVVTIDNNIEGQTVGLTREDVIDKNVAKIDELKQRYEQLKETKTKLLETHSLESQEVVKLSSEIGALESEINSLSAENIEYYDTLEEAVASVSKESDVYKAFVKVQELLGISITDNTENQEENTEAQEENSNQTQTQIASLEELEEAYNDVISEISNLDDAYDTLSSAVDEYNQQGYFSLDTIDDLLSLGDEYLSLLNFENGQVSINKDGLIALANSRIDEAEALIIEEAQTKILTNTQNGLSLATTGVKDSSNNTIPVINSLAQSAIDAGIAFAEGSIGINTFNQALTGQTLGSVMGFGLSELEAKSISNQIKTLESLRGNIGKVTSSTNGHTRATGRNSKALDENTEKIKEKTKEIKKLEEEEKKINKSLDDYETVIDYIKKLLKEEQEAEEDAKDEELQFIKDKIEAKEKEQEEFEKNIEIKIELLDKQREAEEKYWDDQLDNIKDANDALQDNIKLKQLQNALEQAKTRKVKVLKDGKFQYAQDDTLISKAVDDLSKYENELAVKQQIQELEKLKQEALDSLDKQIQDLNDYKDKTNHIYEDELADLQNHYDNVEKEYDEAIGMYDGYLEQFEDMLSANADAQAEILLKELVGEQENWDARLDALGKFVDEYNKKKERLNEIKDEIETITNEIDHLKESAREEKSSPSSNGGGSHSSSRGSSGSRYHSSSSKKSITDIINSGFNKLTRHAEGSYSIKDDEIALVGDKPNRELVIGSKINKNDGILGKFKKGTGIIPSGHNFTETLVNLARTMQGNNFERIINNNDNTNNSKFNISIENINLPQVENGESFVNYLKNNFVNDSLQFANIRG